MNQEQIKQLREEIIDALHDSMDSDDNSVDITWFDVNLNMVLEETFNTQPKMDELTQLRKLAGLLQNAWYNGNWKAETYNEREMEKIMTEQGYWPALPNPKQIGKDELLTFNTEEKCER